MKTTTLGKSGLRRLKLAISDWMAVTVQEIAETLALATTLGLDADLLVDTIADGTMASDYAIEGSSDGRREIHPRFSVAACHEGRRTGHPSRYKAGA